MTIKVLHFTHVIQSFDVVDTVLTRLDRSRFEVSALTSMPARRQAEPTAGERPYESRALNFPFTRPNYRRMYSALVAEIRRFRPHVLHAHHFDESLVASVAARRAGVPCFLMWRHYSDHIYFLTRGLKRKIYLAAENWSNARADFINVPTRDVANILIERQGVPARKVKVIPFGVDFKRYRASSPDAPREIRAAFGADGKYMILACCRLNPEKGLDHLLKALAEVRRHDDRFKLLVVGEGPYGPELRRQAGELGLDGLVQFVGRREDALDWFAACDLLVQPSFCESFCQVLVEAMAFAKPVVMTPVGIAPEAIGANERGRLVPLGDSGAIAGAIRELMQDRELGRRLGELGQRFVAEELSADLTARRFEEFYESSLEYAAAGKDG